MFPYLIVACISWMAGSFVSKAKSNCASVVFCIISILPMCLLAGLRDLSIGGDIALYPTNVFNNSLYDNLPTVFNNWFRNGVDPLYIILAWLVSSTTKSMHALLFFTQLMASLPIILALKRMAPGREGIGLFFYSLLFLPIGFNLMKQGIAVGWLLLAYERLWNQRFCRGSLCFLIAIGFNSAAIIGCVIFPIAILFSKGSELKGARLILSMCLLAGILAALLCGRIIVELASHWKLSYASHLKTGSADIQFSPIMLAVCAIAHFVFTEQETRQYRVVAAPLLLLVILGALASQASLIGSLLGRVGLFYLEFAVLYFAVTWDCTTINSKIVSVGVIMVCLIYFVICYGSTELVPYLPYFSDSLRI